MPQHLDFTAVIAIDDVHAKELLLSASSWIVNRPELYLHPLVLLYDPAMPEALLAMVVGALKHPNLECVPVLDNGGKTQREKMLGALVMQAPFHVKTPVMLKLDTDVIATRWDRKWCWADILRQEDVFAASPWSYTRGPTAVRDMDQWANGVPELSVHLPLNYPFDASARSVSTPGRIISYVFFGKTDWLRWAAFLLKGERMPLYSQDSYHWYVAKRTGASFRQIKMKNFGWLHVRPSKLAATVEIVMKNSECQTCGE